MSQSDQSLRTVIVISEGIAAPYILMDFASALESLGHSVMRVDTRPVCALPSAEQGIAVTQFKREIRNFAPHFALGYGANALLPLAPRDPDARAMHVFEALGIPYCFLMYDSPFYHRGLSLLKLFINSPLSTVFIWDAYYLERFRKQIGPAHYLPLAANPDRFTPQPTAPEFEAHAAFIGSIPETLDFDADRHAMQWTPHVIEIARLTVDMMRKTGACLDDVLDGIIGAMPAQAAAALSTFRDTSGFDAFLSSAYGEIGTARRLEAMTALAPLGVRVYGGPGWKTLAGQVDVRGPVNYLEDAPRVYTSTKINVNVSGAQLVTSVNQRVFDVPACGAFLLTDMRKDASRLFEPNGEIVLYRSPLDMRKKAEYYLAHEDERQAIAARGRARVLREHTYAHRVQTILEVLKSKNLIP